MKNKIEISCNYLTELEELLIDKRIEFNYFKMHPFPDKNNQIESLREASKIRPVLFHGLDLAPGDIGDSNLERLLNVEKLKEIFSLCSNEYISQHIYTKPSGLSDEEVFQSAKKNIRRLTDTFNLPIALENEPFCPGFEIRECMVDPQFISRLISETNSMFLLDIAHAKVAAYYLNMPIDEYLNRLPLSEVYEIHISGTGFLPDGIFVDTHLAVGDDEYLLLEKILKRTPCKLIAIEFCPPKGDPKIKEEAIEQVKKIRELTEK